jgi:hypothetical protein
MSRTLADPKARIERRRLVQELDVAYPDAHHKQTVEHCGIQYRCCYIPLSWSRRGYVLSWRKSWEKLLT